MVLLGRKFSSPRSVPTELEEAISILQNIDEIARQERSLEDLNTTFPYNEEQQDAYNDIMSSIDEFKITEQDLLQSH
jgi:hypothetical protein